MIPDPHVTLSSATDRLLHAVTAWHDEPDWGEITSAVLAGADPNAAVPFRAGRTVLMYLASRSRTNPDGIAWLLDHGASMNVRDASGGTALTTAIDSGNMDIARLLLARGADPNARYKDGTTPLMDLSATLTREAMCLLLVHGADPACVDSRGRTLPDRFEALRRPRMLEAMDAILARPELATTRRRLLDRLTADQCTSWLPKCCAVEATATATRTWVRKP